MKRATVCPLGWLEFYFSHSLKFGGEFINFYFACVTRQKSVDDTNFNSVNPLHVASMNDKLPVGDSRFLPVQRISRKCAIAVEENEHMDKRCILHLYHDICFLDLCNSILACITQNFPIATIAVLAYSTLKCHSYYVGMTMHGMWTLNKFRHLLSKCLNGLLYHTVYMFVVW